MAVLMVPPVDLSFPSLGDQLADFIEERFTFGPGSLEGQPAKLDAEKRALLARLYEVYPQGHKFAGRRRFHRCGCEIRKGLAKTEFAAWVSGCELHPEAPVRCDGFDANGNPVGRPVRSPYIPMMAVTEGQVEELAYGVLRNILENCCDADLFAISKDRIIRLSPTGSNDGELVAVSNAPGSRDGARTTFQHFDEPHRLFMQRHLDAHETMLQNMPKRPMEDPWTLYTSTAGKPGQGSIEENLRLEAEDIAAGKAKDATLFFFARWAGEEHKDLTTVEGRIAAVADATGPVGEWGPGQFERIARDWDRRGVDRGYWERVWLNRWRQGESQAFDMPRVRELKTENRIEDGAFVALGFDGARFRDATALTAVDIETGVAELLGMWERPEEVEEWAVPEAEVTELVADAMRRFHVWRAYCDPPHWFETVAAWAQRWPDQIIEWHTNRHRAMAFVMRKLTEAIASGAITFGAGPYRGDLFRHMGNTSRNELRVRDDNGEPLWVPQKQDGRLVDKIDASVSLALAWEACLDARRSGAKPNPVTYVPFKIR
ncbi:large terminase [Mycolicibacter kumamotonensis]|uniref:Large terminase n=1 Tax=Mycolicibacter kumamotonensis TaxID=354243 RepID=A0A1X0DY22_9MYCO|nr:large terminase [Mycolicibacter kumamotonensis]ORA77191.1 large terminase [Mycolicibacter kumamotonensis]